MKVYVCKREIGTWETYTTIFAVVSTEEKANEICKTHREDWEEFEIDN
jgi:hypothetical protein